jgi:hypothetical protein
MRRVVPVIDQVVESLSCGQIQVPNAEEVREVLLTLRSLALEGESTPVPHGDYQEAADN